MALRGVALSLPKITVVTPSFNQSQFLGRTIASVLAQGYPNLEYIIIDGGSTDGSKSIIESNASSLAYWCSEPDGGQSDALRKGFERATGDVFCWLNSDDLFLPGALITVGRYFASHPQAEVLNGGGFVIDEFDAPMLDGFWTYSEGVAATRGRFLWYGQDGVFQQATFWRREAYQAVGGVDPDLFFLMDKDLFMRLACRRKFNCIPQLLACFRMHSKCKSYLYDDRRKLEEKQFRARYSAEPWSVLVHPLLYSYHRVQSLYRKARTSGAIKLGWKRLSLPQYMDS